MDDKDRELIAQVLRTAGSAGQQGFEALVRYAYIDGITDVIGSVAAIATMLGLLYCVWSAEIIDEDDRGIIRFVSSLFGALFIVIVFAVGTMGGLTSMLAPAGAAVKTLLHHCH